MSKFGICNNCGNVKARCKCIREPIVCEICKSDDDVRRCPIMTGVPFSAPHKKQRYVCGLCIGCWYEGAGTVEEILRERLAQTTSL